MAISWEDHIELKILKKQLKSKFDLLDYLGRGGFGKVFKIEDRNLNRTCALKILNIYELAEDSDEKREESKQRFLKEAKALAKCKHQNIVSIYNIGGEDTFPYLIMEYIEGKSLADLLKEEERLEFAEIVKISEVILPALAYIHANGLIHRDLKPENVILEKGTGRIVIIDFSIARDIVSGTKITDIGFIPGTPFYMAPEQFKNIVVPEIDIYSYGVILFQMLTGEVPYRGKLLEIIQGHLSEPIPDVSEKSPEAPPGIQKIIEKAMAKEQKDRYREAEDFLNDLRSLKKPSPPTKEKKVVKPEKESRILAVVRKKLSDQYNFAGGRIKEGLLPDSYSYLVYHKVFEEDHVLKIREPFIKGIKSEFEKRKRRFKQEAQFFYRFLHHPNIVDIIDAGFIPGEQKNNEYEIPYLIMKQVRGVSLQQLILKEAPLGLKTVFDIAEDVLTTLVEIHSKDYIYWGINPEDIIIDKKNKNAAVIMNAGFFKDINVYNEIEPGASNLYVNKHLLRNLIFQSSGPITGIKDYGTAADICLFGILLYEMATGETRYESGFLEVLKSKRAYSFPGQKNMIPGLPQGIANIIKRTMAREPDQRYKNAKKVLSDLRKVKRNCPAGLIKKKKPDMITEKMFYLEH